MTPPALNREASINLPSSALTRDNYYQSYQTSAGAIIVAASNAFVEIRDNLEPDPGRDSILENVSCIIKLASDLHHQLNMSRRFFLMGGYDDKIQKALKSVESTTLLFGDDMKAVIDFTDVNLKTYKKLVHSHETSTRKSSLPSTTCKTLNFRSSYTRRGEVRQGSQRCYNLRSRGSNSGRPTKSFYPQSQPQRSSR